MWKPAKMVLNHAAWSPQRKKEEETESKKKKKELKEDPKCAIKVIFLQISV